MPALCSLWNREREARHCARWSDFNAAITPVSFFNPINPCLGGTDACAGTDVWFGVFFTSITLLNQWEIRVEKKMEEAVPPLCYKKISLASSEDRKKKEGANLKDYK